METAASIFNTLMANSDLIFGTLLGIVTIASLFIAGTKTPDPKTGLGKVYKAIEFLALTFGKAKDTGTPTDKPAE